VHFKKKSYFKNQIFGQFFFEKLKNFSFVVRLDVERTHINQKIDFFENPTSPCQTTCTVASQTVKVFRARFIGLFFSVAVFMI
jgi:hypothetical protein